MEIMYKIAYGGMLLSAALWFYLKERDESSSLAKGGFWLSALFYVLSFFWSDAGFLFSLLGLFTPDIAFLAAVVIFLNKFAPKPKHIYFLIFALLAGFKLLVWDNGRDAAKAYFMGECSQETPPCMVLTTTHAETLNDVYEGGEILIELNEISDIETLKAIFDLYGITAEVAFENIKNRENTDLDNYFMLNIPQDQLQNWSKIKEELMSTEVINNIEENEVIRLSPMEEAKDIITTPSKYKVNDPDVANLWGFEAMQVGNLYEMIISGAVKPTRKAKIAILDTGIDAKHEDIADNFFSVNSNNDYDKMGHGTHCAGIAAAVSNNGKGIASLAPNSEFFEVTSIKVLNDDGWGTQEDIIDGIIAAADAGVDVISMSLGGPSDDSRQDAYNEAIRYAQEAGAIVVVAAGNSDDDAQNFCPANAEGVIAVSAIDNELNKASFSNYINNIEMAVAAPGVNIYSCFPDNNYRYLNGTSMATPYVAGLVAIMKAIDPSISTQEVYEILSSTGTPTKDNEATGKLINAAQSVEALNVLNP